MEENKKYNTYSSVITLSNLILLFIIGIIFKLKNLQLAFCIVGGFFSILIKFIEKVQKESNKKQLMNFINYSLLLFLVGGLFIFHVGRFEKISGLSSGLILDIIITLPVFLIFSGIFTIFSLLNNDNDKLRKDIEEKNREKATAIEIAVKEMQSDIKQIKNRSNIKGFNELLTTIETKDANVLLVAGNLLSLKTEKGISLLIDFLTKNHTNEVSLIIPEESTEFLSDIKSKVSKKLLMQIKILKYTPFWFLQGIVIIGKKSGTYTYSISPVGCYYYKTKFSESDDMAEEGIFIDLSNQNQDTVYSQSIAAYYFLMNKLKYIHEPYEVVKTFKKKDDPEFKAIHTINWDDVP